MGDATQSRVHKVTIPQGDDVVSSLSREFKVPELDAALSGLQAGEVRVLRLTLPNAVNRDGGGTCCMAVSASRQARSSCVRVIALLSFFRTLKSAFHGMKGPSIMFMPLRHLVGMTFRQPSR